MPLGSHGRLRPVCDQFTMSFKPVHDCPALNLSPKPTALLRSVRVLLQQLHRLLSLRKSTHPPRRHQATRVDGRRPSPVLLAFGAVTMHFSRAYGHCKSKHQTPCLPKSEPQTPCRPVITRYQTITLKRKPHKSLCTLSSKPARKAGPSRSQRSVRKKTRPYTLRLVIPRSLPGTLRFRVYLNPEEPTFLGFLIMISLYKSLKR